jgi:hypothetical protein
VHFVTEAGGRVSDQNGREIVFDIDGYLLSEEVEKIITSCGGEMHEMLLQALQAAVAK